MNWYDTACRHMVHRGKAGRCLLDEWGEADRHMIGWIGAKQVDMRQRGKQWGSWVQSWWTCGRAGWDKAGECESEQVYNRQAALL